MGDRAGGAFRALRVRNFRLFFIGQVFNVTGSWVHNTAIAWIVVKQPNAAAGVSTIVAMQFLPLLLLGAWAGAVADRVDKRRLLIAANGMSAAVALTTAILVSTGHRSITVLALMALLLGVASAFETPTRQSLLGQLVDADNLPSAVGLNGSIMTGSRMAGSAIAGALIVAVGSSVCIYLNALSFLATIAGVVLMRPDEIRAHAPAARAKGQVREGLAYAARHPDVRFALVAMAVVGTLALNNQVTTPLLARVTFDAGPVLFAAFGALGALGALGGTLFAASRNEATVRVIATAALAFGTFLTVVSVAPHVVIALVFMMCAGFAGSLYISTTNARLQTVTEDRYRGRVMSLYSILFLGSTPVGSVIVGAAAEVFNPRVAVAIGAIGALATGVIATRVAGRRAARVRAADDGLTVAPSS